MAIDDRGDQTPVDRAFECRMGWPWVEDRKRVVAIESGLDLYPVIIESTASVAMGCILGIRVLNGDCSSHIPRSVSDRRPGEAPFAIVAAVKWCGAHERPAGSH